MLAVLPYAALAFCVLLSLALPNSGPEGGGDRAHPERLSAAWMLWMFTLHPAWRRRPRVMALFITVLIVLGAFLVLDNTLFGLYTFTIYFYVLRYMVWPWRLLGAAAVGLLAATSQAYGVNKDTLGGVLIYLIIIAVNVGIALAYTWSRWTTGWTTAQAGARRAEHSQPQARGEPGRERGPSAPAADPGPGGRASWTSGSGWPGRSTTPWPRG